MPDGSCAESCGNYFKRQGLHCVCPERQVFDFIETETDLSKRFFCKAQLPAACS